GTALSRDAGESQGIYCLTNHPGWLAKIYKLPLHPSQTAVLDRLIALPADTSATDHAVISRNTSWPVARVTDAVGRCVGCIIPEAPVTFRVRRGEDERFLEVDLLAKPADAFPRRGLSAPTYDDRVKACSSLAAVAAVLEHHDLVYSDWSYSNAFWSASDYSVYVIDIDGCRFGTNHNIHQPNWDDPLTLAADPADTYTDRYRSGLLVARCLTGYRDRIDVLHCLAGINSEVAELLLDVLLAADRRRRPTASALSKALTGMPYLRIPLVRSALPTRPVAVPSRAVTVPIGVGRPVAASPAPVQTQPGGWFRPLAWAAGIAVATAFIFIFIILVTRS